MGSGNARVRVRRMTADDIGTIDTVLRAAYGVARPYRERLEGYLRQRGAHPLVAEYDGRTVGVVCGNDYGTSAYVSLMGVDPALQGRGVGHALMTALMAWCDERAFRDVRLDATPSGAPLYERFGFADFGETTVMERARGGESLRAPGVTPATAADIGVVARLDAAAFGADRMPMLEQLLAAHGALIAPNERGYAVVQHAATTAVIGPWIAHDEHAARELLDAALARLGGREPALFVPSTNRAALELAAAAGFVMRRTLRHMIRGAGALPSPAVFGRANLGQG